METYIEQILLYFKMVPDWPLTLLGFIILVALGVEYFNRRRRADTVEHYNIVFMEELDGLYPNATRWPDDFVAYMQPRLPIMRDAFEMLRTFLPQDQLRGYNIAWNSFYGFSRTGRLERGALDEDTSRDAEIEQAQQQQIFQQMVSELLAYTKQFKK